MTQQPQSDGPPLVAGVALLIGIFALWALTFSHGCRSDGCIGIVFPAGAAVITLAVQMLVVLPLYISKRQRRGESATRAAMIWGGISLAAFFLPMVFLKW